MSHETSNEHRSIPVATCWMASGMLMLLLCEAAARARKVTTFYYHPCVVIVLVGWLRGFLQVCRFHRSTREGITSTVIRTAGYDATSKIINRCIIPLSIYPAVNQSKLPLTDLESQVTLHLGAPAKLN